MPNVSVAQDVADLLDAQAWPGWTVFVGEMPAEPDQAIAVFEAGGDRPETRLDIDRPVVQVRVRGARQDWAGARAKLADCTALLHKFTGTLTGTYYVQIIAAGGVLPLGQDASERHELTQNFEAMRSRG